MRPFDLEAALRGEPVMTRNGVRVEKIAHFPNARYQQKLAVQINDEVYRYSEKGKLDTVFQTTYQNADLVMAPKKKVAWVNLYEYDLLHVSEASADACAINDRIGGKAFRIEWEE